MLSNEIKEVNAKKKRLDGYLTIAVIILVIWIGILYWIFLRDILADTMFGTIVGHIKTQIASFSELGSLYIALFGGLFFIFIPMEAYYMNALSNSNTYILYSLMLSGIIISYSIDYFLGMKFSKISRKLISPKKFYGIKQYLNRYGQLAIFIAHVVPVFPSPQVTFILGVFRYNKMKLIMIALPAQMLKFSFLLVIWSMF